MCENLWPDFTNEIIEENNSLDILRNQARQLSKQTSGKVKASFSKIEYSMNYSGVIKALSTIASNSSEIEDDDLKEKKDANELYKTIKYKFEIYNDNYKFRIFVLNYKSEYPLTMDIDEDILSEITYTSNEKISNDNQLKELLIDIFSCEKVKTIIIRMIQDKI